MPCSSPAYLKGQGRVWRTRARELAGVALCALVGLECTTARERPSPPAREAVSVGSESPGAAPIAPVMMAASTGSVAPATVPARAPQGTDETSPVMKAKQPPPRRAGEMLSTFYGALRELESGTRRSHVRVLWLGDSHGAADFWSGSLRTALQKRFGNGGPGFVHAGYREYRHDGVKTTVEGKWKLRPPNPATRVVTGDGVFGLGGILFVAGAGPRATVTVTEVGAPPKLTWDLCYRLGSSRDELTLSLSGKQDVTLRSTAADPPGALRHFIAGSDGPATWSVAASRGFPEICGVVIEADPKSHPGVVLDTLGINGARFATPLAWNEAAWSAELARRAPELVVLEYGTNELGDIGVRPSVYGDQLRELMVRIRKVRGDVDCVALAPTDRADTENRTPAVRDAIRQSAMDSGCAFWDTYAIMGGKGAIKAWRSETPPRAAKDGVHLSWRGYRELGSKLAEDILRGYTP